MSGATLGSLTALLLELMVMAATVAPPDYNPPYCDASVRESIRYPKYRTCRRQFWECEEGNLRENSCKGGQHFNYCVADCTTANDCERRCLKKGGTAPPNPTPPSTHKTSDITSPEQSATTTQQTVPSAITATSPPSTGNGSSTQTPSSSTSSVQSTTTADLTKPSEITATSPLSTQTLSNATSAEQSTTTTQQTMSSEITGTSMQSLSNTTYSVPSTTTTDLTQPSEIMPTSPSSTQTPSDTTSSIHSTTTTEQAMPSEITATSPPTTQTPSNATSADQSATRTEQTVPSEITATWPPTTQTPANTTSTEQSTQSATEQTTHSTESTTATQTTERTSPKPIPGLQKWLLISLLLCICAPYVFLTMWLRRRKQHPRTSGIAEVELNKNGCPSTRGLQWSGWSGYTGRWYASLRKNSVIPSATPYTQGPSQCCQIEENFPHGKF